MASKATEDEVREAVKWLLDHGYTDAVSIEVIDKNGNWFSETRGDSLACRKLINPNPWVATKMWCMRLYRNCIKKTRNCIYGRHGG